MRLTLTPSYIANELWQVPQPEVETKYLAPQDESAKYQALGNKIDLMQQGNILHLALKAVIRGDYTPKEMLKHWPDFLHQNRGYCFGLNVQNYRHYRHLGGLGLKKFFATFPVGQTRHLWLGEEILQCPLDRTNRIVIKSTPDVIWLDQTKPPGERLNIIDCKLGLGSEGVPEQPKNWPAAFQLQAATYTWQALCLFGEPVQVWLFGFLSQRVLCCPSTRVRFAKWLFEPAAQVIPASYNLALPKPRNLHDAQMFVRLHFDHLGFGRQNPERYFAARIADRQSQRRHILPAAQMAFL